MGRPKGRPTSFRQALDGEQAPLARHALQLGDSTVAELDPRARNQVLDGARDEHLARPRLGGYACPDVHRDAADLAIDPLALARVQSGANLDTQLAHSLSDRVRAPNRTRRAVERREEAVARGIQLGAAEAHELAADEPMVRLDQLPPA